MSENVETNPGQKVDPQGQTPPEGGGQDTGQGLAQGQENVNDDPGKKLTELADALKKSQETIETQQKAKDRYNADLNELKGLAAEIEQIVAGYEKALPDLNQRRENIEIYKNCKSKELENIKDKWEKIITIRKNYDDKITKLKSDIGEKTKKYDDNLKKLAGLRDKVAKNKSKYEEYKNSQKALEASLKSMEDLTKEINKEVEGKKYYRAYGLLLDVTTPEIKGKDTLAKELKEAWTDLFAAKEEVRTCEGDTDWLKIRLEADKNSLLELEKNRRADILKALDALK